MSEDWIKVDADSGMFSNEYKVNIKLSNGKNVSLFADESLIKKEQGNSYLKVTLINDKPNEKKKLVLLPTEPFGSSRWAEVAI